MVFVGKTKKCMLVFELQFDYLTRTNTYKTCYSVYIVKKIFLKIVKQTYFDEKYIVNKI